MATITLQGKKYILNEYIKDKLKAQTYFYIEKDGDDNNDGLTKLTAKKTWAAVNRILHSIDWNFYTVTVNFGEGIWTEPIFINNNAFKNPGHLQIFGTTTGTGTTFSVNVESGGNVTVSKPAIDIIGKKGPFTTDIRRIKFTNNLYHIRVWRDALCSCENPIFGEVKGKAGESPIMAIAVQHGNLYIHGTQTIINASGKNIFKSKVYSTITIATPIIDIPYPITFDEFYSVDEFAKIDVPTMSYIGAGLAASTGKKYLVNQLGILRYLSPTTNIPGATAGELKNGGLLVTD